MFSLTHETASSRGMSLHFRYLISIEINTNHYIQFVKKLSIPSLLPCANTTK